MEKEKGIGMEAGAIMTAMKIVGNRYRTDLLVAPIKTNRQIKSHEENESEKTSGTKKGPNNI